jgi:hypothetical protein
MITKRDADRLIELCDEMNKIGQFPDIFDKDEDDVPEDTRTVFVYSEGPDYDCVCIVGYGICDDGVWYDESGECEISVKNWSYINE